MGTTGQTTERIEALRALMDRLVSPDLTLGEAKELRCRLLAMTGQEQDGASAPGSAVPAAPSPRSGEGRRDGIGNPGCRNCAA